MKKCVVFSFFDESVTDRQTDRQMDGRMDGWTDPLIGMYGCIKKIARTHHLAVFHPCLFRNNMRKTELDEISTHNASCVDQKNIALFLSYYF